MRTTAWLYLDLILISRHSNDYAGDRTALSRACISLDSFGFSSDSRDYKGSHIVLARTTASLYVEYAFMWGNFGVPFIL